MKDINYKIKASMDISQIKGEMGKLQNMFNSLEFKNTKNKDIFSSLFKDLDSEFKKYSEIMNNGFKNATDINSLNKSSNKILSLMDQIQDSFKELNNKDLSKIFEIDSNAAERIKEIEKGINGYKEQLKELNKTDLNAVNKTINDLKTPKAKERASFIKSLISEGDIETAKRELEELIKLQENSLKMNQKRGVTTSNTEQNIAALTELKNIINNIDVNSIKNINENINNLNAEKVQITADAFEKVKNKINETSNASDEINNSLGEFVQNNLSAAAAQRDFNNELSQVTNRVKAFFGLNNMINLFQRTIRQAYETVKELDAAMTETAVVTDFSVSDMWDKLPQYTETANKLGTTTLGAYETMTLFYQQGLKTNEAFEIGTETMKMARIANLDYAEATDLMTAA